MSEQDVRLGRTIFASIFFFCLMGLDASADDRKVCLEDTLRGDLDPVYAACSRLLDAGFVKPDQQAKYHWRKAEILYRQRKFKETLEAIDLSLLLAPRFPLALMRRAAVLAQLDRRNDAFRAAVRLYETAPDWSKSSSVLADLSPYHITFNRREKLYARAVKLDPTDYVARMSYGRFLHQRGKIKQAEAQWQVVLDADREAVNAQYRFRASDDQFELYGYMLELRGTVYTANNQNAKALADFNRLIELHPDKARGYYLRAALRVGGDKTELAEADIDKALELLPGYLRALELRVQINLQHNKYEQVVRDADIVLAGKAQQRAWIERFRASALRSLGRSTEAFGSFLASARLDPKLANDMRSRMARRGYYSQTTQFNVEAEEFQNGLMACSIDPDC